MKRIVVVGGGWAGCAAAWAAARAGTEVILLERTDAILGTGLVGGIMDNNGRFTVGLELRAMGAGDFLAAVERVTLHRGVEFPGHHHASLYDVSRIESSVRRTLEVASQPGSHRPPGVELRTGSRVVGAKVVNSRRVKSEVGLSNVTSVVLAGGEEVEGDAFVDATGTAGPMAACVRHGNGCALCVLRCPAFGGRVGVAEALGITGKSCRQQNTTGAMSGSCELDANTLGEDLRGQLARHGVVVYPLPPSHRDGYRQKIKACGQYALEEYSSNLVMLNTGKIKLMAPYFPLESLRMLPGFEEVRFVDPLAGGIGNSIRFTGMIPGEPTLQVPGISNLFVAGEKAGPLVGHTEAMVTGLLAGFNAARRAHGRPPVFLPRTLAAGDGIYHARRLLAKSPAPPVRLTFSGAHYFHAMKKKGLYTLDPAVVNERVRQSGWEGIFSP